MGCQSNSGPIKATSAQDGRRVIWQPMSGNNNSNQANSGSAHQYGRSSLTFRRVRAAAIVIILAIGAWGISQAVTGGAPTSTHRKAGASTTIATTTHDTHTSQIPALEAGQLPWNVPLPIQRELAVPAPSSLGTGKILIAGGLSGSSLTTLSLMSVPSGVYQSVGNLPVALHDAAGATLDNQSFIFGGGTSSGFTSDVIAVSPNTAPSSSASNTTSGTATTLVARVIGHLPQPRADAVAVIANGRIYIIGGYDNGQPSSTVLSTSNGINFTSAGRLQVPVRYPAVAALGHMIYVFGGIYVTGQQAGKPTSDIQMIDLRTGRVSLVGRMPIPLEGASAAVLDGHIYLAGGVTNNPSAAGSITGPYSPVDNPEVYTSPSRSVLTTIWAFQTSSNKLLPAGQLRTPTAHSGVAISGNTAWLTGGESATSAYTNTEQMMTPNTAFGYAGQPGAGSPYYGEKLLVADEGNNRLIVLNTQSKTTWQYPSGSAPAPPGGFSADDAFFARHGSVIVTNEENENVVAEIAYPSGKILWTYGHFGVTGAAPGFLNTPDDAYMLKGGNVVTADIANCRVIVINPLTDQIVHQIGTTGRCIHDQDHPVALGSPNGDTPLPNGNLLISEINGHWVDEYTMQGKLVWSAQIPISYPSDPQRLGPNRYLIADYTKPGAILIFNRSGQSLYRYQPRSGPNMLDHPSLVEMLPSGVFMLNDDHNDRMIAIDPATGALVWQYGITHTPGNSVGYLNVPDGFDILGPNGTTPTHPATG